MLKSKLKTVFFATSSIFLTISLIIFPEHAFQASIRGLNMWWEIVFPSLLPFFIVSELLIGFGVVKFIGVLLEPLMRPLFRVPGTGAFVWAMGVASGYPVGAKLTARLRQTKQITRIEAERLISFTNSTNPLFIFGAVAVGFFKNSRLGLVLALAHYLSNLTVGLLMRFYRSKEDYNKKKTVPKIPSLKTALSSLHQTRLKDNRPFGKLLGDAIVSSIETLLMIGGFIIIFSVVNRLLFHLQITVKLAELLNILFNTFNISTLLSIPFISGLFEITLGSQLTSQIQNVPLVEQAIVTSFILAFSGISVQAQVASIISQTDIRFLPYFTARIIHGFIASIYTILLWKTVYVNFSNRGAAITTVHNFITERESSLNYLSNLLSKLGPFITIGMIVIYIGIFYTRNKINTN